MLRAYSTRVMAAAEIEIVRDRLLNQLVERAVAEGRPPMLEMEIAGGGGGQVQRGRRWRVLAQPARITARVIAQERFTA